MIISKQPDEVVFVRPNVPIGSFVKSKALLRNVSAEVTVGFLGGNEGGRGLIELRAKALIPSVRPGKRRGMHPFANVFANPRMNAGLATKTGE